MSFLTLKITFTAIVITLAVSPIFIWLNRRLSIVDIPGREPHKQHSSPTPIAGGQILLFTFLASGLIFGVLTLPAIQPILLPAVIVFLFGLWDDIKGISPLWKFIGQFLAAILLIFSGVQVLLFTQPWINYTITLLWLIGITNAYNFVDSMDGLVLGLGGLAAAFFVLVTFDANQLSLSTFSLIIFGASIGAFYFNARPAKYFMGDSGSQLMGFLLASLGIAYNPIGFEPYVSWFIPILLMAVPIFDTVLIVFSRIRRGNSIFKGANDHTYHRLVALGMDPYRAVLTMQIAALLLGSIAFLSLPLSPLYANLIFAGIIMVGIVAVVYLDHPRRWIRAE
jgi:UDP-GlcNAc:undecaprenyl-phosphate GlcNAc-1-phosphate transferase